MCEFLFFLYISDVQTTTVRESRHCNIMSRDLPGYSLGPVIVGMCNLPYSQIILNDSSLSRLISAAAGAQLSRAAFHAFVCFDESFALLWFHVLLLQTTFWVVVLLNSPSSQSSHSLWEVTLSCFSASEDDCVSHHCANFSSGPSPAKHIPCRQHVSTSSICYFTSCLRPLLNPMSKFSLLLNRLIMLRWNSVSKDDCRDLGLGTVTDFQETFLENDVLSANGPKDLLTMR